MPTRLDAIVPAAVAAPPIEAFCMDVEELHRSGFKGQGVTVAVVDSGVDTSDPETMAAVIGGVNLSGDGDRDDLHDYLGHGGLVAKLILRAAPSARLYVIKVFGRVAECTGELAGQGLMTAAERGDITNASLGGPYHPAIGSAVRRHEELGKPLIAAAGNSGDGKPDTIEREYPAAMDYTTAVGAIDRGAIADTAWAWVPWRPAKYSSSYPEVDLVAIGRIPGAYKDGTSFAAPLVAGASASLKSMYDGTGRLWNDAVNYLLLTHFARQLPGLEARNDQTGFGMLTFRAHTPEHRVEIDVDTKEVFLDGKPVDMSSAGVENRPPGGLYLWLRPFLETAKGDGHVGYDAGRRRAWYLV